MISCALKMVGKKLIGMSSPINEAARTELSSGRLQLDAALRNRITSADSAHSKDRNTWRESYRKPFSRLNPSPASGNRAPFARLR